MLSSGVIILDAARRVLVVSPGAEDLLGWRETQVEGIDCRLVLDCRDEDGASLCDNCGAARAFANQEMTPYRPMQMADATGGHCTLDASFWFLPPTGFIYQPRVMAVFNAPVDKADTSSHEPTLAGTSGE